jgi:hypothetical protein
MKPGFNAYPSAAARRWPFSVSQPNFAVCCKKAALETSKTDQPDVGASTGIRRVAAFPRLELLRTDRSRRSCRRSRRLFDHLVGAGKQRRRRRDAERPGGFQIHVELKLGRQLHRQIGRARACQRVPGHAPSYKIEERRRSSRGSKRLEDALHDDPVMKSSRRTGQHGIVQISNSAFTSSSVRAEAMRPSRSNRLSANARFLALSSSIFSSIVPVATSR